MKYQLGFEVAIPTQIFEIHKLYQLYILLIIIIANETLFTWIMLARPGLRLLDFINPQRKSEIYILLCLFGSCTRIKGYTVA